ncbi:MAG: hypothetical protein IJP68_12610, partial [Selenomonadaceae bacterium]|nr:hypothetical protein [Selenomonadaceae bacterium]
NGDMTVTNTSGTVTVGALETGDTFTVDGVAYKMTDAGLLDTTNQQICAADTTSYTIGDTFTRIIAVDNANLSLSSETKDALVYDSISDPTTKFATLTVASGKKTLTGESNAATNIQSIDIAARDNLAVDFVTQVNSPSGVVTVNSQTYSGTDELKIDSDGKTSTLYSGTLTLNGTYTSATDSKGNTLTRDSGTFNATAEDGKFTELTNLGNTESFTYGDKTYTQGNLGLVIPAEIKICTDITPNTTIELANLNTATWNDFLAPINNVLDISALSDMTMIYDDGSAPTKHLATFTMSRGQKTLAGESGASNSIQTVVIAAGDDLTIDFDTQISSPIGNVTVNGQAYSGTTALVIDSDSETSKLYSGTINLNRTYTSATDSKDNTLARASGDFTATASGGSFKTITGLDTTESFTYNGVTYVQTALGLRNESLIRVDLTSGTIDLSDLYNSWANILAPRNGVLDISEVEEDAIIFDNATNPTTRFADLIVDNGTKTLSNYNGNASAITIVKIDAGDILTIDFATTINAPIGAVTVNNKDYVGTTALVIASDGTTSTLTQGTITLTDLNDTVTTTSGSVITYTVDGGDGMTVAVDSSGITFSDLTNGDTFTVGEAAYKVTAVGPMNASGALWKGDDYTAGITLDALNTAANWTTMLAVIDDALSINAETLADGGDVLLVDNVTEPTKLYGELTKVDGTYNLTNANDALTSIT